MLDKVLKNIQITNLIKILPPVAMLFHMDGRADIKMLHISQFLQ